MGCEIIERNFPDTPHWETWDFFSPLINLAVSIGELLILSKLGILSYETFLTLLSI